jgi:hypothetical protein
MESDALALEQRPQSHALSAHAAPHELRVIGGADQLERTRRSGGRLHHVAKQVVGRGAGKVTKIDN